MIAGTVTTHVFWRGRDRAPFVYAGVGAAAGVWGEKPVEILWRFDQDSTVKLPAPDGLASSASQAATVFRHGPPPSLGLKQMFSEDGVCPLYLMRLDGAVDALFPTLAPTETKRAIIKVGISREPARRERELNAGFPRGAQARWTLRDIRPYPSVGAAYDAEGLLLEALAREGRWISGEFAIVPYAELSALLHI